MDCDHIKADGTRCGSPALGDGLYCYFHRDSQERIKRQRRAARRKLPLQLPVLEDAATVQLAIGDTLNALLSGQIDHKTAGLLLYGLQTAAINARHVNFEKADEFDEYDTLERDVLEEEIEDEIEAEQKEAAKAASPVPGSAVELPAANTMADPALPPKKTPDSAANGSAKKKVSTS